MEKFRISERNNIKNEINRIESSIKKADETIERLRSQDASEFNKKQVQKLVDLNNTNNQTLEALNKRYNDVLNGLLDNELNDKLQASNKIIKDKQDISDKKVKDKNDRKKEDKHFLDKEYQNRRNEFSANYLQRETDRFFKNASTVPDYILDNLKDMPNNKGYIWRDIVFFGKKPAESNDVILFEKCKGGLLKIRETTKEYRYIYEKIGKGQKVLISQEKRKTLT